MGAAEQQRNSRQKIGAIIQARVGSTRLPGKSLKEICGKTVLEHVINRARLARSLDGIFVATTDQAVDDAIVEVCSTVGVEVFRGSESNVLERMLFAARYFGLGSMVRITSDNPLVGADVIDWMVTYHLANSNKMTTSYQSKSFPNGTVISVIDTSALEYLTKETDEQRIKEHIVFGLDALRPFFKVEVVEALSDWRRADLRYCIDTHEDFQVVTALIEHFSGRKHEPSTLEIIEYLDTHPEVRAMNLELALRGY